jgi:hypothetical protein
VSDGVRKALAGIDTRVPNIARMIDYALGGKDNFAADREAAERVLALAPELRDVAREDQKLRHRLARHLIEQGISQFVVLGAGLPTQSNVHEIAQSLDPRARTVYVERDAVVLNHARALLATDPGTGVVRGDVMHPEEMLADPGLRKLIDLDRPVALLLLGGVLHYIPDSWRPFEKVALMRDAMAPGSHLAITHVVFDARPEAARPMAEVYREILGSTETITRTFAQVERFFDGLELVEPGLVYLTRWRPDEPAARRRDHAWSAVGVARKR